jgi:RNA polymerase sigma factor (sigma-70 family)
MRRLETLKNFLGGQKRQSDDDLLRAIARGDMVAFERLHHHYFSKVAHFAKRVTGNSEAAEEIASDTLMVVWRTAERFEGRSKPSSWIFGIAYRLSLRQLQTLRRRKNDVLLDEELIDDREDAATTVMRQRELDEALRQLTPELRAVVELTYYNGYLYTEIAEILGCPVGTVKTRMMTARRRLRQLLSGDTITSPQNAVA